MNILKVLLISILGLFWSGHAAAGVVGSKHDLTAGGGAQATTNVTDQVCVFCHTPHGSDTTAPVPLWNKVLGAPGSYTQYSNLNLPSFDATEAPVGSVSLACLSCHDGTQAMDVVINQPGGSDNPNNYNPAGAEIDPLNIGLMTGTPVPNLGTDLQDDHPISMQYAAGGPTAADADGPFTGVLGDPDFNAPQKATVNGNPIWWVDNAVGTNGQRDKTDMILYARADLGTVQPFVECGSCHDPHNNATGGPTSVEFLRIDNTASRICTTCHIK